MLKPLLVLLGAAAVAVGLAVSPRIPQDPAYHAMADIRTLAGVPNALNVLSNVPFALVGLLGLRAAFGRDPGPRVPDRWLRWSYGALFGGVALTAVGSSYYHLAPDNARLVWDRLPMTIGFMGLLTCVIAERVGVPLARRVLVPSLLAGALSVYYWFATEMAGNGDLRPYILVQFGSLVAVLGLTIATNDRERSSGWLLAALAGYGAAKVLETADHSIYSLGGVISGHTLKHVVAAASVDLLVAMLRRRAV